MNTIDGPALPEWKIALLMSMTLLVVASAHWHSFREAWPEMQARNLPTRWRQVLSYLLRHEFHYAKQVPLMVLFVLSSVAVVAHL